MALADWDCGLAARLSIPAKLGMFDRELMTAAKLAGGVPEELRVGAAAGWEMLLAAPAKLGMRLAMSLAMLCMDGGDEGVGPEVESLTTATPYGTSTGDPASSSEGEETVTSSQ